MPSKFAHFQVEVIDETHVLRLRDQKLIDSNVVDDLREELLRYVADEMPPKLVISFKEVARFSSENFGALLDTNNLAKANDCEVRLCEVSDQIREIFAITRLDQIFEIHGSIPGAMGLFKVKRPNQ